MAQIERHHEGSEDAENSSAMVDNIVRLKELGGVKKMQAWFDRQSPEEQASLLRAEDTNALTKVIGKIKDVGSITNVSGIMKSLLFFAATYGIIDVDEKMLQNSRGLPNSFMFMIPDAAARALLTALGAGAVYPVWKLGKIVDKSNENIGPEIRKKVHARMATLRDRTDGQDDQDEQLAA